MTSLDPRLVSRHCPDCGTPENPAELFCTNCYHLKGAVPNVRAATFLRRASAFLLDLVLFWLTLVIGYIIWWLFTLAKGQTPGKQLVGIRAVKTDGRSLGWGMTFVREFIVKSVAFGFLSGITFGISTIVNYLFPLIDKDLQTLHDKVVSTVVVRHDPGRARQAQIDTREDPWSRQVEG